MQLVLTFSIYIWYCGSTKLNKVFPLIIYGQSCKGKKILCPVECKTGSRCNADQDCPKGQCTTINYFDTETTCVCDKDCKQGSICYPDIQDAEPCAGNGRCKQIGMYKHICECGEGNNNKNSSMVHPFRMSAI